MVLQHLQPQEAPLVLQAVSDMLLVFRPDGELLEMETRHPKLHRLKHARQLLDAVPKPHRFRLIRSCLRAAQGRAVPAQEFQLEAKNGELVWVEATAVMLPNQAGQPDRIVVVMRDVSERKTAENALRSLAFHDSLTGLPNRRLLMEHLKLSVNQAKRQQSTLALLHLDIDDFKRVNDSYGHDAGDELLKAFALRLFRCIREVDLFARIGGDEFTILLPAVESIESVIVVAERIYLALRQPFDIDFATLPVGVSMGIAVFPANGEDAFSLLRRADIALYDVKGNTKNAYRFFRPDMTALQAKPD